MSLLGQKHIIQKEQKINKEKEHTTKETKQTQKQKEPYEFPLNQNPKNSAANSVPLSRWEAAIALLEKTKRPDSQSTGVSLDGLGVAERVLVF